MKRIFTLLACALSFFLVTNVGAQSKHRITSLLKSGNLNTKLDSLVIQYISDGIAETDVTFLYEYDSQGIPISVHEVEYGESYDWEITYNAQGQVDVLLGSYEGFGDARVEFEYDNNGSCISETEAYYDDDLGDFLNEIKYEYTYENGKLISYEAFDWDYDQNEWEQYSTSVDKLVNNYENDIIVSDTLYDWDETDMEYTYDEMNEYIYSDNLLVDKINYEWNSVTSEFEIFEKWTYEYDANGNLIAEFDYFYDDQSTDWVIEDQYNYTYNLSIIANETSFPTYYDFETEEIAYTNVPVSVDYSYQGDVQGRALYYYSDILIVSISEQDEVINIVNGKNISIDVPFTQSAELIICSVNGQVVYSACFENTISIPTNSFGAGMYIYSIRTSDSVKTGKLIVE